MEIFTAENFIALLTLTALEIVLGIDNIIFISVLTGKLDRSKQASAQRLGLILAMGTRIALLLVLGSILMLTKPILEILNHSVSGRDLVLLMGGSFLIGKATVEIHDKTQSLHHAEHQVGRKVSYAGVLFQIALLDIVFSLDSVITAVGMARELEIMIAPIVIAVLVMLIFAKAISCFIEEHPTFKILALSFLLLVGMMLVLDGLGTHVDKGYIYFAIGFSLFVEVINLRIRKKTERASAP